MENEEPFNHVKRISHFLLFKDVGFCVVVVVVFAIFFATGRLGCLGRFTRYKCRLISNFASQ